LGSEKSRGDKFTDHRLRKAGQSSMLRKRVTRVILLGLAFLSLPLCFLPVCAFVPSYPMFWGRFTVLNESDETLYITPIGERYGQRRVLLENSSRFPYGPILKQADVRLDPGESVQIFCRGFDEPSWTLTEIVVRSERGEYQQRVYYGLLRSQPIQSNHLVGFLELRRRLWKSRRKLADSILRPGG
jgi:hypothetical protein